MIPAAPASPDDDREAARILRRKAPLLPADFARLDAEAKKRAFTVTDEVSLDVVRSMRDALARAKESGVPYRDFVKAMPDELKARWSVDSPQLKTVFANNVYQAANQAIVARLNRQRGRLSFWTLDVTNDEVTSSYCSYFVTYPVVLPAGHPWWAKNAPMRHHRCRTLLKGLTRAEAKKLGITTKPPVWPPQQGWGGSAPLGAYRTNLKDESHRIDATPSAAGASRKPRRSLFEVVSKAFDYYVNNPEETRARLAAMKTTNKIRADARAPRPAPGKKLTAGLDALAKKAAKPRRLVPTRGLRGFAFRYARGGHVVEVRHSMADDGGTPFVLMRGDVALFPGIEIDRAALLDGLDARFFDAGQDGAEVPVAAWSRPKWNQLAKIGSYRGHPAGPFELSPTIFSEIDRNFRASENRRIPIDFEHASEQDAAQGDIPVRGAPAHGWILDLDDRGAGGLWGLTTFHPYAARLIRDEQYLYFSPAIRFGAKDRVTGQPIGARMTSGALTNNPFLDGMAPMQASDKNDKKTDAAVAPGAPAIALKAMGDFCYSADEIMPRLRYGLGLGEMATLVECAEAVERLEAVYDECVAAGGDPMGVHMGAPIGARLRSLRDAMQAGMASTWPDLFDLVRVMLAAAGDADEVTDNEESDSPSNAEMTATTTETHEMSDTKNQQNEFMVRLTAAEQKIAAAESKAAGLELQLADKTAKLDTAEIELKALRDEQKARRSADEQAAVDVAFSTYKDVQKLSAAHKEQMLLTYKNNRALFDTLYPPIAPDQRHLQRDLSSSASPGTAAQMQHGVHGAFLPVAMSMPGAFAQPFGAMPQYAPHAAHAPQPSSSPGAYGDRIFSETQRLMRDKGLSREQATIEARRALNAPPGQHT